MGSGNEEGFENEEGFGNGLKGKGKGKGNERGMGNCRRDNGLSLLFSENIQGFWPG